MQKSEFLLNIIMCNKEIKSWSEFFTELQTQTLNYRFNSVIII